MDFSTHLRASGDAQSTIDLRSRHLGYLAAAMGRPACEATAAELETFLGTPGWSDGHLSSDNVGRQLKALCPPGYSGHSFRHRYASVLYGRTQDIRAVQELLGHASIATTQRYVAMDRARIREVAALAA